MLTTTKILLFALAHPLLVFAPLDVATPLVEGGTSDVVGRTFVVVGGTSVVVGGTVVVDGVELVDGVTVVVSSPGFGFGVITSSST